MKQDYRSETIEFKGDTISNLLEAVERVSSGRGQAHPSASGFAGSASGDGVRLHVPAMSENPLPDSELVPCAEFELCGNRVNVLTAHRCKRANEPFCDDCYPQHVSGFTSNRISGNTFHVEGCKFCRKPMLMSIPYAGGRIW